MNPKSPRCVRVQLVIVVLLFVATVLAPRAWRCSTVPAVDLPARLPVAARHLNLRVHVPATAPLAAGPLAAGPLMFERPTGVAFREVLPEPRAEIRRTSGLPGAAVWDDRSLDAMSVPQDEATRAAMPKLAERRDSDATAVAAAERHRVRLGRTPLHRPLSDVVEPAVGGAALVSLTSETSTPASPAGVWPVPTALLSQLEQLDACLDWRERTTAALHDLAGCAALHGEEAGLHLATLEGLRGECELLASRQSDERLQRQLNQLGYALQRRLAIWRAIERLGGRESLLAPIGGAGEALRRSLENVERPLALLSEREGWEGFLMIDQLRSSTVEDGSNARLAMEVLERIEVSPLTPQQREWLQQPELVDFAYQLRSSAAPAVDFSRLLVQLERLEAGHDGYAAAVVARHRQLFQSAEDPRLVEIGNLLETHYRNANARFEASAALLQRFLPEEMKQEERIAETVVGARVFGRGRTLTRLKLTLVPHAERWQVGISANGEVDTSTRSTVWPATFYNRGRSRYSIRKPVVVDSQGIRAMPARGTANTRSRLSGLETDFDAIPLLGLIVQATAQRKYEEQLPRANREVRSQVAETAAERLDEEVERRLGEADQRFRARLLAPLQDLGLEPTPVEMQTTGQRLVGRFRLAANEQTASYTARPKSPPDSLLALQLHESAVNNALDRLNLQGRRFDLAGLYRELADAAGVPDAEIPLELQDEEAVIEFADHDPVDVRFSDERLAITLRLAQLQARDQAPWRGIVVRAFYAPVSDGPRQVALERDGYIQLSGARLRLRDQIVLRGIFSKLFPRHPDFNDQIQRWMDQPQVADAQVTQFVARDGWLGLALSPVQSRTARKDTTQQGSQQ
ncbi:MAG: hypothetical protein J5I93_16915 [Pirellulaceae bacterium]|nr:hypothetical protein [Pirellulaceae bacterium]